MRLCIHQRPTWQTSHTSTYSNWCRDRHEHGNNGTRQTKTVHILDTMPTSISHWMWKDTSHFGTYSPTIRSGGIPHFTAEDNSEDNWKQHFSRQSPAYSSQSQGSIERFHRTLFNQVRTLTAQLKDNYKLNIISIIQSCHGWLDMQLTYSIGMQSTMMAKLPTSGGGTKSTRHHYASLVKQYNTW